MNLRLAVDSADLDPETAAELAELVDGSGFMALEKTDLVQTPTLLPDDTAYWVRIDVDERSNAISVTRSTAPARIRPLLERLYELALDTRK
jgi:hypothetical protein